MTAVFTNRLIGSAILVVAAVVFLPDLLDGRKQVNKDDFKAIPERPEFAEVAQPAVFSQDQHQAAKNTAMTPVTDNSQPLDVPATSGTEPTTAELPAGSTAAAENAAVTDPDPAALTSAATTQQAATAAGSNVQAATLPADTLPAETTSAQSMSAQSSSAETNSAQNIPAEKPAEVKAEKPLAQAAFVVKVGSFSKEQNANALVSKLKAAGHNAFTRKIVNGQGVTMVSVLVGPDLKKDKLEARLTELQQLAQVPKLKVSSYQPVENQ